jgi:DNA polymerase-1
MIDAFKAGGDFHSRTAMGMYDHVRRAIDEGKVLLEWGRKDQPAPAPLLKDIYAAERRKAKGLNFSIAYGKTARGLADDWETSIGDAEATVERWYQDRPEVKQWQLMTQQNAHATGNVRTLMGIYLSIIFLDQIYTDSFYYRCCDDEQKR